MLSEVLATSTLCPKTSTTSSPARDAGIHLHTLHPSPTLKASFKRSSTAPNCLAVSPTHIFAAQADKAVVHVYSRERGNQEVTVPFAERIRSVALAGDRDGAGVLLLGTESPVGGRVILWEICTGRQVSTAQSHLSPVTTLAVDPTSQFLLSGSTESQPIHVWSLSILLSFSSPSTTDPSPTSPREPLRTLPNHRAGITGLVTGHSHGFTNIAVSSSRDNTCIVWNYHTGDLLRTYLLGSAPAVCLALDPADRAFYAGFEDGSIQQFDFFKTPQSVNPLHDVQRSSIPLDVSPLGRWTAQSQKLGTTISISMSYDGTKLFSGHEGGKVISWDVTKGRFSAEIANLASPVTNLIVLAPIGFPDISDATLKIDKVIKPNYDISFTGPGKIADGAVPSKYTITAQFVSALPAQRISAAGPLTIERSNFDAAFTHPSFPPSILEDGMAELATWKHSTNSSLGANFAVVDGNDIDTEEGRLRKENRELLELVGEQQRVQKRTWEKLIEWGEQRAADRKIAKEASAMEAHRKHVKAHGAMTLIEEDDELDGEVFNNDRQWSSNDLDGE